METRANYVLIGLFTLAVIAAGFGFVYWFHRGAGVGERASYQVVFDGPVSGVRTGAAVLFNGIRIGEVADITLNPQDPRQVVATIIVAKGAPVRTDTKVGVEYQGLTGIAALSMRGGSPTSPALTPPAVLRAEVGTSADVMQSGREVLRRLDEMLLENQEALRNTIKNIESFSGSMARNSDRIDRIVEGAERTVAGADAMINGKDGKPGDVQEAVQSFRRLADNLDKRAEEAVQSVKKLTDSLENQSVEAIQSVKKLADNLDKRTADIAVGVTRFSNQGLQQWERLAIDGRRAANEFERAVRNFDRNPSRVIWGGSSSADSQTNTSATTTPRRRAPR